MEDIFVKLPLRILEMKTVKTRIGEVGLSLTDKVVYCFFLMKIQHFCKSLGGEYFETQEHIANVLGLEVQVLRRSLNKLITAEILFARKIRYQGRWKWVYTNIEQI